MIRAMPAAAGPDAVVEPEADQEAETDDEGQGQRAAAEIGQGPAGQKGRAGHRKTPETVDHASLKVLGQGQRGGHPPDQYRLQEDAGDDVVDIVDTGDLDGSSEHVSEQQQDDRGLDDGHEQQLRGADDPQEVASGDTFDVAEGEPGSERGRLLQQPLGGQVSHGGHGCHLRRHRAPRSCAR